MSKSWDSATYKISALKDEPALDITDSPLKYTLNDDNAFVSFQNNGDSPVWIGGSSVDADTKRGHVLYPTDSQSWEIILEEVYFYFQCATGETSTISIIKG